VVAIDWYQNAASAVEAVVTAIALLAGGVWAFWRYQLQGEKYPHIETLAEIEPIGVQGGYWIVEVRAVLANKGKVEQKIKKFEFDLNGILESDSVGTAARWSNQVHFPHEFARGSFLPADYEYFALGPGVTGRYSFVTRAPENTTFLMLHCYFDYANRRGMSHSMEKTIALPRAG
jgi:hypothetical protein